MLKKLTIVGLVLALMLVAGAAFQPSNAICALARLLTSLNIASGNYTYIYTPGQCDGGYPCAGGSSVSTNLQGAFWVIGDGNTAGLMGNDNGGFPALEGSGGSYYYGFVSANFNYGYPAFIDTSWAADPRIDGCPDAAAPDGNLCTAVLLTDQDGAGNSYFALVAVQADGNGNYFLDQAGSAPITLAPLPAPGISGSTRNGDGVILDVNTPASAGDGSVENGDCADAVAGYQTYMQRRPRGSMPPSDRDPGDWMPIGPVGPGGGTAQVAVDCSGNEDVYLTTSIVYDSGFETLYVGANSSMVECGPNVADPIDRPDRPKNGGALQLRDRVGKSGKRR